MKLSCVWKLDHFSPQIFLEVIYNKRRGESVELIKPKKFGNSSFLPLSVYWTIRISNTCEPQQRLLLEWSKGNNDWKKRKQKKLRLKPKKCRSSEVSWYWLITKIIEWQSSRAFDALLDYGGTIRATSCGIQGLRDSALYCFLGRGVCRGIFSLEAWKAINGNVWFSFVWKPQVPSTFVFRMQLSFQYAKQKSIRSFCTENLKNNPSQHLIIITFQAQKQILFQFFLSNNSWYLYESYNHTCIRIWNG